jgi:DNA-binding Xre family transcriptional regulator
MLKYNIKYLLEARGITKPLAHLTKAGITYQMAHLLVANKVAAIKPAVIEKLCIHLNCTPNDLMEWIPEKNNNTKNHPLESLQHKQPPQQLQNIIADIPVSKLKEFETIMLELKKELLKQ